MDIQQVARRAKVSTATVSRVLNGSSNVRLTTIEHVRRVIAELNYVPNRSARSLRIGRSRLFGLIVSDINNPFFPELIDAFEALAAEQGIEVIFTHTNYDPERLRSCMRRLVERNVDGIAVMTSEVDEEALQQATAARVPLVLMNQRALQARYRIVPVEYAQGLCEALEHLRSLGHRDIAFIAGPPLLESAKRRLQEWKRTMTQLKLRVRPQWIGAADMRVEGGMHAMEKMLALPHPPSAVLASNDLMAVGALKAAIHARLQVPQELSIIGFDDLPIADMVVPPLSSIQLPRREIAAHAFKSLLQATLGTEGEPCATVYSKLVLRQSTAPARRRSQAGSPADAVPPPRSSG